MSLKFKKLEATLPAGTNTHTFNSNIIGNASVIEVYTNDDEVYPVNVSQSGHSCTVELSEHANEVKLCITINNVEEFKQPIDYNDLDNKPNALPADGGNADTVDNKHADEFASSAIYGNTSMKLGGTATGALAVAHGQLTEASGQSSHAEGDRTKATNGEAHAEGWQTVASGSRAHSEGHGTIAAGNDQHVSGRFNVEDTSQYAYIIGNGSSDTSRSNAFTVDWNGNIVAAGEVTDGHGNKLSEATVIGTESPLKDSANGNIKALKLLGNSYKSGNEIIIPSGDITSHNADNTRTATVHTDRPLLSVNDIKNELIVNADGSGKFVQRVGIVDLGTLTWTVLKTKNDKNRFNSKGIQYLVKRPSTYTEISNIISDKYNAITGNDPNNEVEGITIRPDGSVMIYDSALDTVDESAFKVAMNGIRLVYELATPIETDLTQTEVNALLALQTFENETYVDADGCAFEIKYNLYDPFNTLYSKIKALEKRVISLLSEEV